MVVRRLFEPLLPGTCTSLGVPLRWVFAQGLDRHWRPYLNYNVSVLLRSFDAYSGVDSVRVGGGGGPYDRSREELRRDDGGRATLVVS
jgi:hypothetical protein